MIRGGLLGILFAIPMYTEPQFGSVHLVLLICTFPLPNLQTLR